MARLRMAGNSTTHHDIALENYKCDVFGVYKKIGPVLLQHY